MRTIKFKGKSNIDGTWVYGDFAHCQRITQTGTEPCIRVSGYDVDENTVGQFTGLYDKNGKEIYEGDIVKLTQTYYEVIGKIVYENTEFCLYVPEEDTTYNFFPKDCRCTVIGNIHDNPELLKGGEK